MALTEFDHGYRGEYQRTPVGSDNCSSERDGHYGY